MSLTQIHRDLSSSKINQPSSDLKNTFKRRQYSIQSTGSSNNLQAKSHGPKWNNFHYINNNYKSDDIVSMDEEQEQDNKSEQIFELFNINKLQTPQLSPKKKDDEDIIYTGGILQNPNKNKNKNKNKNIMLNEDIIFIVYDKKEPPNYVFKFLVETPEIEQCKWLNPQAIRAQKKMQKKIR